jgi:hypothetical protein
LRRAYTESLRQLASLAPPFDLWIDPLLEELTYEVVVKFLADGRFVGHAPL